MRDYHVHSNFSDDCSKQPLLEACKNAEEKGILEIAFTEHVDMDYPQDKGDFQLDYDAYSAEIVRARELYPNLTILKGLELGIQPQLGPKINEYLSQYSFDFILGSIHSADGLELFNGDFTSGKEQQEAVRRYFEIMYDSITNFADFHVLAHFDLISRYGNYPAPVTSYKPFYDIIDEIYKLIIYKGIGIEINTSGWRYGLNASLPGKELLKRYKDFGGEILTFGSDAHRPEHMGFKFAEVYTLAKDLNFKYYSYYRDGKPQFAKIP